MLKSIVKSTLVSALNKEIHITFRKPYESYTGEYKVLSNKTGRGKGGSLIVEMLNIATGDKITHIDVDGKQVTMGTAMSDYIVNMTFEGNLLGPNCAEEDLENLPKDPEMAVKLREALLPFLGKDGIKIQIDSKLPMINGVWMLSNGIKSPGVFGQLRFDLTSLDGTIKTQFWSYRFSGCVQNISIIEDNE